MSDLILSVDCSTSAVKCIAWGLDGTQVSTGGAALELSIPEQGYGEQDPRDWWNGFVQAVRSCLQYIDPARVKGFAITHQRETFACLDSSDAPIRPAMLWLDVRAGDQVDRFGTKRIHELTGKPANPTPAFYKLLWLRENEPATLERTAHIVDVHAYLAHELTGEWKTSVASADPLGLIDLETGDYSDEILKSVGINRALLPELVEPGELLGSLNEKAAKVLGLSPGVPIISGAGDGQSAGLGAGIVGTGLAYLNVGSGLISGFFSDNYSSSTAYRAMAGTIPGTFNYELFVGAGTLMVSWFMKTFAANQELPGGLSKEVFWERQAQDIEPGAGGLFVLPYWNGQLTPYWDHNARGVMIGFTGAHESAHVYRAMLEGVAFELRLCLEEAEPKLAEPIKKFIAMGGGTRSPLWCQIFADVLNRPIALAGSDEATALGAGILAAVGVGLHADVDAAVNSMTTTRLLYEPNPETVTRYEQLYQSYRTVYPALKSVFLTVAQNEKHKND
jgi:xylulokinase